MKIKRLWYVGLLGILLMDAGCSSGDAGNVPVAETPVEIRPVAGVGGILSDITRGAGMVNSTFTTDLGVGFARADATGTVPAYPASYQSSALSGVVDHTTRVLSFNPSAYYLADGNKTRLIGWYPGAEYTPGGAFNAATGKVEFGTLDGSTDVMATPLLEGDKNGKIASVAFSHLLTQISVKVYTQDATTRALWGRLESIRIKGMGRDCVLTPPAVDSSVGASFSAAFTGSSDLGLVPRNFADNTLITGDDASNTAYSASNPRTVVLASANTDDRLVGYAMFAPVDTSSATDAITLAVVTEKGGERETGVPAPADVDNSGMYAFKRGVSYEITLKLGTAEIAPTVTITDWATGTTGSDIEI